MRGTEMSRDSEIEDRRGKKEERKNEKRETEMIRGSEIRKANKRKNKGGREERNRDEQTIRQ